MDAIARCAGLVAGAWLLLAGCASTASSPPAATPTRPPLSPKDVAVYGAAQLVTGRYEEVALLDTVAAETGAAQVQTLESLRASAARLGANAVILDALSEPKAGARVAGTVPTTQRARLGRAVAIFIQPSSASSVVAVNPNGNAVLAAAQAKPAPGPAPTVVVTREAPEPPRRVYTSRRNWYLWNEVDFEARPLASNAMPTFPDVELGAPGAKYLVVAEFVVNDRGFVELSTFRAVNPEAIGVFIDAVREVARKWQFVPAMRGRNPVRSLVVQRYEFIDAPKP